MGNTVSLRTVRFQLRQADQRLKRRFCLSMAAQPRDPRRALPHRRCNAATSVALLHQRADPAVPNDSRCATAASVAGKENHANTANDILQWNVAHGREDSAVGGVV